MSSDLSGVKALFLLTFQPCLKVVEVVKEDGSWPAARSRWFLVDSIEIYRPAGDLKHASRRNMAQGSATPFTTTPCENAKSGD